MTRFQKKSRVKLGGQAEDIMQVDLQDLITVSVRILCTYNIWGLYGTLKAKFLSDESLKLPIEFTLSGSVCAILVHVKNWIAPSCYLLVQYVYASKHYTSAIRNILHNWNKSGVTRFMNNDNFMCLYLLMPALMLKAPSKPIFLRMNAKCKTPVPKNTFCTNKRTVQTP
jgi:hypothetical protein